MRVRIESKFATAEDTAKALGVSRRRLNQLLKLLESNQGKVKSASREFKSSAGHKLRKMTFKTLRERRVGSLNGERKMGPVMHRSSKSVYSSRKRQARAKGSKASR